MVHYFTKKQDAAFVVESFTVELRGGLYTFFTAPGVFSKKKVDFGTRLLVSLMDVLPEDRVLDLGCGIGVVGRVAASLTGKGVVMVDVNPRAVRLARMNTKGLGRVVVKESDGFAALQGELFSLILLNPPQAAGKRVCQRLIVESSRHLVHEGRLELVARHRVGGASLAAFMKEVFGNVAEMGKKGGYRVYVSRKAEGVDRDADL